MDVLKIYNYSIIMFYCVYLQRHHQYHSQSYPSFSSFKYSDEPEAQIGIVLVGTCPGGWLSNIFSVLLDVDFTLSITMTFFSSIIALGMMPLNLLIYASPFTGDDSRLGTPFVDLIQQLVILILPVFLGIGLSYKFEK